ncbi:TonB-dependent receptor plug domain-containing protein [Pseudoxanthomonas composti]|uniref:TonB-dependent receptor n=1 Tax=Pseudoxanthomonas composti TaxID=2137479 RepID=A0A4Q1K001_9GAMM|nr:TonB-dependent receptor [Pseudoxanthomonas composti]RXR08699.1 TonB-dependent receptor [Pseudoxanthomonas composti]
MKCNTHKLRDAVVLALVAGAGVGSAHAQEATTLDRVEVTGSRIRSVDLETSQPIFTVSAEDIQKSGLVSVGDILQNLSISGTQNFSRASVLTSNPEQGGQYVNIYNLNENRTLVLVNGKRWTSSLAGYTDLSTIPSSLIERIEVLKDGASAIYGSDAIAGVVNIILRTNYEGAEFSGMYGQNSRGDGAKKQYSMTLGSSNDRSSIVFGANYSKEDPVFAKDRELTRYTYGPNHKTAGLSPTGPWGRFIDPRAEGTIGAGTYQNEDGDVVDGPGDGISWVPNNWVINHTGTWDGVGVGQASNNFANYHNGVRTDDRFNATQQMHLTQETETKTAFTSGRYDFTDSITFKSTAMYSERNSVRQVAGYPLQSAAQPTFPVFLSADSYYNPMGDQALGEGNGYDLSFFRRTTELPRISENNVKAYHFDAAVEGAFDVANRGWNWDVGFNYNKFDVTQIGTGNINLLALERALGPSFLNGQGVVQCGTPDAPIALGTSLSAGQCTPFDLLGGPSASTADALKYVGTLSQATQQSVTKQYVANITGGLFDLPGGEFSFASGYERREVSGYDNPDQLSSAGFTTDLAGGATRGDYKIDEFYLELMMPVLRDVPLAKELTFDVAARYSDYSNLGDTTNTKFSFTWKPIDDLLVRGTYGHGFRAPTLDDTFGGGSQSFDYYTDPCDAAFGSTSNAAVAARCASEGLAPSFRQADNAGQPVEGPESQSIAPFQTGVGNTTLEPEYSRTRTVGLVYSPSWLDGFDVSLDWYKISISNIITAVSATYVLNQCYIAGSSQYCDQYTRDATSGQVTSLSRGNTNLGNLQTEGYNFGMRYRLPETAIGNFSVNLDTNYLANYRTRSSADAEWADYAGYWNFPRVRGTLGVNWSKGDLSASWNLRYYGGFRDYCVFDGECNDPDYLTPNSGWGGGAGANKKGSISYQDVSLTWQAPWNGAVTVGARNIWDKEPPVTYSLSNNSSSSIDPMLDYDRYVFMQYTQRF